MTVPNVKRRWEIKQKMRLAHFTHSVLPRGVAKRHDSHCTISLLVDNRQ